ncbi:MAG: L,D-transpeptidase family protein [Alphaproteobacteria bacterium]|nr:L,D-transpeptidase family protein [Alphaproteobacteria bacterium]
MTSRLLQAAPHGIAVARGLLVSLIALAGLGADLAHAQPARRQAAPRQVERIAPPTPTSLHAGASAAEVTAVGPLAENLSPSELPIATALQAALGAPTAVGPANRADAAVTEVLRRLYRERGYAPAWLNDGIVGARAQGVIALIERSAEFGFSPTDYRLGDLRDLSQATEPQRIAQFELAMARAVLRFGIDMQGGRVSTLNLPAEIRPQARAVDGRATLAAAAAADDPAAFLHGLAPQTPEYALLVGALRRAREIAAAGGWPTVPEGPTIEPGATDPRVGAVRARLAVVDGAAAEGPQGNNVYDAALQDVVKRFQRRHGIGDDARIGRLTVRSLNQTAEWRVQQILVNLDRLRAMPARGDATEIVVNIPEYRVRVFEGPQEVLAMNVVVGREARPTPLLTSRVVEIIFNPTWTVPLKLSREDLLPRLRRNPQEMVDKGFRVYRGWSNAAEEIDIVNYDWRAVRPDRFNFMVRQEAGPRNALGQLRLTLVNTPDIYMHDTPDRHYFARDMRALSSGCVRLERPVDMVEYVLRRNRAPEWTQQTIRETMGTGDIRRSVPVARPIAVQMTYITSWVNADGDIQFREDIYNIDQQITRAQEQRPVAVVAQGA